MEKELNQSKEHNDKINEDVKFLSLDKKETSKELDKTSKEIEKSNRYFFFTFLCTKAIMKQRMCYLCANKKKGEKAHGRNDQRNCRKGRSIKRNG